MWSFGVFISEMMVGYRPFNSPNDSNLRKLIQTTTIRVPSTATRKSEHIADLILKLLERDASTRLTVAGAMAHPFWQDTDGTPLDWARVRRAEYKVPIEPMVADVSGQLTQLELMAEHDELEIFDPAAGSYDASRASNAAFSRFDDGR